MRIEELFEAPASELALPVEHLSATSTSMFMRCPEQFRRRYVLGEKERPGGALVLGRGFHFAQETNFRQKLETYRDLPMDDVVGAYHAGWDQEVAKYGGAGEIEWDDRLKPDTLRHRGEELVRQYHLAVAPKMQPTTVEEEFNLVLPEVPVPFNGYLDFFGELWPTTQELTEALPDGGVIPDPIVAVVDYKTASSIKRELKPEWLLQARLYQLQKGVRVEYHVAAKTKEPTIVTPADAPQLAIEPTEQALATTTRLLQRVTRQIAWHWNEFGPDQAWPGAVTHPWSCAYCGYRPSCMWMQGWS